MLSPISPSSKGHRYLFIVVEPGVWKIHAFSFPEFSTTMTVWVPKLRGLQKQNVLCSSPQRMLVRCVPEVMVLRH
jgi:hypothetical protein